MKDFAHSISAFLSFRKYDILKGKGSISKKKKADSKAIAEYEEFNKNQKILSDIERCLQRTKKQDSV